MCFKLTGKMRDLRIKSSFGQHRFGEFQVPINFINGFFRDDDVENIGSYSGISVDQGLDTDSIGFDRIISYDRFITAYIQDFIGARLLDLIKEFKRSMIIPEEINSWYYIEDRIRDTRIKSNK